MRLKMWSGSQGLAWLSVGRFILLQWVTFSPAFKGHRLSMSNMQQGDPVWGFVILISTAYRCAFQAVQLFKRFTSSYLDDAHIVGHKVWLQVGLKRATELMEVEEAWSGSTLNKAKCKEAGAR